MSRAKTGFLPGTGSVIAQVLVPLWSVVGRVLIDFIDVSSVFIDVNLLLIMASFIGW
jgi:hypothetical protein